MPSPGITAIRNGVMRSSPGIAAPVAAESPGAAGFGLITRHGRKGSIVMLLVVVAVCQVETSDGRLPARSFAEIVTDDRGRGRCVVTGVARSQGRRCYSGVLRGRSRSDVVVGASMTRARAGE